MFKKCIHFCIVALLSLTLSAQNDEIKSENGWFLPVKGNIRIMLVFVEVEYDLSLNTDDKPKWARGDLPPNRDAFFDPYFSTSPKGLMTEFFAISSFNQYRVLGSYVNKIVTVKESEMKGVNQYKIATEACNELSRWSHIPFKDQGLVLDSFDLISGSNREGLYKALEPDGKLDHVMFILRNYYVWANFQGQVMSSSPGKIHGMEANTFSIFAGSDFNIMRHEYNHLLFGGNNFHTGGGQHKIGGYNYFGPLQCGWSCMGDANSTFLTCNAWDRDRLNWIAPDKQHSISALDFSTKQEVFADIDPHQDFQKSYLLRVRDFMKSGDAVRIKIPYIPESEFSQWLWIENHQTKARNGIRLDDFQYTEEACRGNATPGLYMYFQVDKNAKSGKHTFGGYGDYLRFLTADGFYDIFFEDSLQQADCVNHGRYLPFYKSAKTANPLSGTHDLEFAIGNFDKNPETGETDDFIKKNESRVKWIENRNGRYVSDLQFLGLPSHAFTKNRQSKIGMGTNPSLNSMMTQVRWDTPLLNVPNNRKVWLNGISVEIVDEIFNETNPEMMDLILQIKFNDTEIKGNLRWCADSIMLSPIYGNNGRSLCLLPKSKMLLDRGTTPSRVSKPEYYKNDQLFTSNTTLNVLPNAVLYLSKKSSITIQADSELILYENAFLILENKAKITVKNEGKIKVHKNAKLIISPKQLKKLDKNGRISYFE
jgi:hypothetical protein